MRTLGAPTVERENPFRRKIDLQRFPWWLVLILAAVGYMVYQIVTDQTYNRIFFVVLEGLGTTVYVTILAFLLALLIGMIAGLGRISSNIVVRNLAVAYIEFVRGVPILVLIFTIAFVIVPNTASFFGFQNNAVSQVGRAVLALALIYGAYLAEVFRAGVESIPRGQTEAARSLGMTRTQAMRYIVLPQAIRNVLPAVGNDFIAMLKDSSLVSVLAVRDLTQVSRLYSNTTFQFTQTYFILTFFYLVMTLLLSLLLQALQRRLGRNVRSNRNSQCT